MCSSKPILLGGNHGKNLSENNFVEESLWGNRVIRIQKEFHQIKNLGGNKKKLVGGLNPSEKY